MRKLSKKMLSFPLCCLSMKCKDLPIRIINYGVYLYAKTKYKEFQKLPSLLKETPSWFNENEDSHWKLLLSSQELNFRIEDLHKFEERVEETDSYIKQFQSKYGSDAFCLIGKELLYEVHRNSFDMELFRVICAINSVLGRKKYARITKKTIRHRMQGYKTMEVLESENQFGLEMSSDRVLGRKIEILIDKKFITKFTYNKRQSYYSTRLSYEDLVGVVKNNKVSRAKRKLHIDDWKESQKIIDEINSVRKQSSKLKLVRKNVGSRSA